MKPGISLEALEILDAIDRQGSFAAAAEKLHKVPSAVTYSVQKLEQDLRVTLFRKEGRRSVMTPAGQLLLTEGRELLAAARRLAEATRQVERGWESKLTLAIDSLIDFSTVADALGEFLQLETGTEIRLTEEVLSGAWEAVLEDRADLVVGAPQLSEIPADLETRHLMNIEFVFAVAPTHPLAQLSKPLTAADIEPFRAVVASDTARHRATISRRVFRTQPVLAVTDISQKIEAQRRGFGVGYLPLHRIREELARGELVLPQLAEALEPSELVLAWRRGKSGRALHWFVDWFSRRLN